MKKEVAEFIGTFTLIFMGCGTAIFAGSDVGIVGISIAFGLALTGMAYGIGPVSGCHINPAVSLGVLCSGRMEMGEFIRYVIAQCLGAIAASLVLYLIVTGRIGGYDIAANGFAQNGWGADGGTNYSIISAFLFEAVATFLFLVVILGATQVKAPAMIAGLAIGLMLTAIHLTGINITSVSVNPARSLGPALFAGTTALSQLWLFIVAPCVGAAIAGLLFKAGTLDAD